MNLRPDFVSHIEYRKACLGQIKPESREPGQTVDIPQWRADHARRGKMLTEVSCLEASVLGYLQIVRGYPDHLLAGFLPLFRKLRDVAVDPSDDAIFRAAVDTRLLQEIHTAATMTRPSRPMHPELPDGRPPDFEEYYIWCSQSRDLGDELMQTWPLFFRLETIWRVKVQRRDVLNLALQVPNSGYVQLLVQLGRWQPPNESWLNG